MWYIEVLVADATYHKNEALTYATQTKPESGQIVLVPLRNKHVPGIVIKQVSKPVFAAKEVIATPDIPRLPPELRALVDWMRDYYPAPLGITTQLVLPSTLSIKDTKPQTEPQQTIEATLPPLTKDQQRALDQINNHGLYILHGETGSGKTRVYIELAKRQLTQSKSCIVLTPEIGLTSQLTNAFTRVFGNRVVVMHSGLTDSARRKTWNFILQSKQPLIVIGARSALFSPLANVGLIVVDESHETAYKQDQAPYYQTNAVAAKLAELHKATVVLGSATPLVRDYYVASVKKRPIIRMTQVAAGTVKDEGKAIIVNLKDRSLFPKSQHLSSKLIASIEEKLRNREQTLLFLNRRGTARVVFCSTCGWQALCPHCDLPLVYHGDNHTVRCHSCSHKANAPAGCPSCKSGDVIFRSIGTKAVAEEVKRLFPQANVMRFDTDNKKSENLNTHYEDLRSGKIDIIVGTQTLAKGLDLPKLGLVGVIVADTSLSFPDFSAQERTYQLLGQVLGRIGRGHIKGQAVIQTYSPESPLIQHIINKNWDDFYNNEIAERRQFLFPPFCYLLKLSCKRASDAAAQKAAQQLANTLKTDGSVIVEGPSPSFRGKVQNKFVWQLVVKAKKRDQLVAIIKSLPSGWSYDIDPMNLL